MSQIQYVNLRGKSYRIRRNGLVLRNKGINSIDEIEGLNNLPYLATLDLSNNNITEIRGLQNLPNLIQLNLSYNNISEIKGLENLSNLVYLDLSRNNIVEIKGLENLHRLITLNLSYNNIAELKGLDSLSNLLTLNLERNLIREIKGLEHLSRLNAIYLANNYIAEVKGIEHLRNLKRLDLGKRPHLSKQKAQAIKRSGVLLKEQHYHNKKIITYLIAYFIIVLFVDLLISFALVNGFKMGGEAFLPMFGAWFVPSMILAPFCYVFGRAYSGV